MDAVDGCVEACRRCEKVVQSFLEQDPRAYAAIGQHLRHCLDHFQLFLEGWASGAIDYDARRRDERTERDPAVAQELLRAIQAGLAAIGEGDLDRELSITQSVAPGRPPVASRSRVDRELAFLSSHTIHHIAIMVLAARAAGVAVPEELAVAYATDVHRAFLVKS
jgi:uncharacterized damage-inducible protein DinB